MLEYKEFGSSRLEEIKEIYREQGWTAYLNDDEKLKLIGFVRCVGVVTVYG